MAGRLTRAAVVTIGTVISTMLVAFAFYRPVFQDGHVAMEARFAFGRWAAELPSHLPWVLPFALLTATQPVLRAFVWRWTLPDPVPSWGRRFHGLALGGFVHNVMPGRLGPLASAWVLASEPGLRVGTAFSSLLVAKLFELGALFATTSVLAGLAQVRGVGGGPARALLVGGLIAMAGFTAATLAARTFAPRLARRLIRADRLPRVASLLENLGEGLAAVASPRRVLLGSLTALLPVAVTALAYGLALRFLGVSSYLLGGGLMVGALTLSQFTPGLPIGMGVYYLVCTATARALGVDEQGAAALAVLSHAVTSVTHLVVGMGSAIGHRDRLRELLRRARAPRGELSPLPAPSS